MSKLSELEDIIGRSNKTRSEHDDLRKRSPRLPLIAVSGRHLADELLRVTKLLGVKATFKKPSVLAQLLVSVEEALPHAR